MSAAARFEIVRVQDGYFARFVAANNRVVWVTPGLLSRRRTAVAAVESVNGLWGKRAHPVRDVDLRGEGVGAE